MKKKLWIIPTLAALLLALTIGAATADRIGTISSSISWNLTDEGVLTISGTGAIPDYGTAYNLSPFDGNTNIREVVVGSGITALGNNLFFECANLTKATIRKSDAVISDTAFRNCPSGLKLYGWSASTAEAYAHEAGNEFVALWGTCGNDVIFEFDPDTLILTISGDGSMTEFTNANPSPFDGRGDIAYVDICAGVTSVGAKAFYNCGNLLSVSLPDTVTVVGDDAFRLCYALSEINLPDGLMRIGDYAFYNDSRLSGLVIPAGVTFIGNQAFRYCSALKDLTVLSRTATFSMNPLDTNIKINLHGYSGSTAQSYANSHSSNVTFVDIMITGECGANGGNVTYSLDPYTGELTISGTGAIDNYNTGSDVPWSAYQNQIQSIVVENGVTSLGLFAFSYCTNLISVTLPNNLTSTGDKTFSQCSNLTNIILPENLTTIGLAVFYGCSSLNNIIIPAGVTEIGPDAFRGCSSLTGITIPNRVTAIYSSAFQESGLVSISIPSSVATISKTVFYKCADLTSVTIMNPNVTIGTNIFYNCPSSLTIHGWNPSTAKTYATENGISFESLGDISGQIGDDVYYTFDPVTGAVNITGTGPMWDYDDVNHSPFFRIDEVTGASIADGVTSIGDNLFAACNYLAGVAIPSSVTRIGCGAFDTCVRLSGISIPGSVTEIGAQAFSWCAGLINVTIPNSVTVIGERAFSDCENLVSVTFRTA